MNTFRRGIALAAATFLLGTAPLFAGVKSSGSNTYTIDNGGSSRLTVPAFPNTMITPCAYYNYHKPTANNPGFAITSGAIVDTSFDGEIQTDGYLGFCDGSGNELIVRRWQLENFGNTSFVTAETTYIPSGCSDSACYTHYGRLPVFQVNHLVVGQAPDSTPSVLDVSMTFDFTPSDQLLAVFPAISVPLSAKTKATEGTLLYTFTAEQEVAPTNQP
jgi:hypothetical protein